MMLLPFCDKLTSTPTTGVPFGLDIVAVIVACAAPLPGTSEELTVSVPLIPLRSTMSISS
jgi:hypothetical protein